MKKLLIAAAFALLVGGVSPVSAQFMIIGGSRNRQPALGVPLGGGYGSYGTGSTGGLFSGGGLFGGNLWGTGMGGGAQSTVSPNAPGYTPGSPGTTGRMTLTRPEDQNLGNITGHTTRYFYYSHYFMNQGGGSVGAPPTPGTLANPGASMMIGSNYARSQPGAAPERPPRPRSAGGR